MAEPSAGATPVVPGATPSQNPEPADDSGYPDGMGDAGKKALDTMRRERGEARTAARKAAEELETLKSSLQSEQEKAVTAARKEGATEVATRLQGQIRRAEVKAALTAAGLPSQYLSLATAADQFTGLRVSDDGEVEGVDAAVADFKKSMPALFGAANGQPIRTGFDGGPRGTPAGAGGDMNTLIRRASGRPG